MSHRRLPSRRGDTPGSWHHVVNRGIARRPMFEDRQDVRYFLSRLAKEVRRGRIEVHAYCVLTTHFHALVRSPGGELSEAMRRAQNEYSRHFNRRHRRDGTLIRGRFHSRCVDSMEYRKNVVRYIDANPVRAGIVGRAWDYPWCSAAHYARGGGPAWLDTRWVASWIEERARSRTFTGSTYVEVVTGSATEGRWQLVEDRLKHARSGPDELDQLVTAAPRAIRAWMERKARLADGVRPGLPVCDVASIRATLAGHRDAGAGWELTRTGRRTDAWSVLEVGLLRDLAGLTLQRVAAGLALSHSMVRRRLAVHAAEILAGGAYARVAANLAREALEVCHGVERLPARLARAASPARREVGDDWCDSV